MRLYLVRRTRSFIQENYAEIDPASGRKYLKFADGTRSYFPTRIPKTVKIKIDEKEPNDQYARLFADDVVKTLNHLTLPRYGLGNYQKPSPHKPPTPPLNYAKQPPSLRRPHRVSRKRRRLTTAAMVAVACSAV